MAADEHIRVSKRVLELLDQRRREGESYNDAPERMLSDDRNLTDGMGFWTDSDADVNAREVQARGEEKTLDRTR